MKNMINYSTKIASTFAIITAGMLLSNCTVLQPVKSASITTYALEVQFDAAATGQGKRTLLVTAPIADPGFNSSRMVYIKNLYEIDYFSLNQWVDSPARMLAPLLVLSLERTAQFRAVVQVRSAATADLRLDTEIVRLQHEFLSKPSRVHLTVRAQLLDIAGQSVIATHEFDITETARSDDPYGGVVATNLAVKKLLLQIAEFCVQESKVIKVEVEH